MSKAIWVLHLPIETSVLVSPEDSVNCGDVLAKKEEDKFVSPVDGRIVEVKDDKIRLKFRTKKISGQAVGQGRHWGELVDLSGKKFWELTAKDCQGKLVFVSKLTSVILTKLKALEVSGIICQQKPENAVFPILKIDEESRDRVISSSGINCLLDVKNEVLLIPDKKNEKK